MDLTRELRDLLLQNGAKLVGIGDLRAVQSVSWPIGVSIAIPLPKHITRDLQTAPTKEYYDMYYTLNHKLNEIVAIGEQFLIDHGYEAYAQTTDRIKADENRLTRLPHKTVATRAGLGWIGKNCLLVTEAFGSAVRLSSLLTNAPLHCDPPINHSRCGKCSLCVNSCPGQALKGTLWEVGVLRRDIIDVEQCYQTQLRIMTEQTGIAQDLCGKCFATCAYTRKYLQSDI